MIPRIYTRKTKGFSSIYPFVFAVENALRSVLDYLEERFGRMEWWTLIRNARQNGQTYTAFSNILGTPVNPAFVKAAWRVFDNMVNPQHINDCVSASNWRSTIFVKPLSAKSSTLMSGYPSPRS